MSDVDGAFQPSLVADVGRTTVRIGLTDRSGHLEQSSVREYDPKVQPTISSSISAFASELALPRLPRRAAIAVSGVPRGETIVITNSRWILSRSGLTAMFQAEPLIINDFAATAWALGSSHLAERIEAIGALPVQPHRPGTYCIIGIGSGLGVAALSRDRNGLINVVPTEAGHMALMGGLPIKPALLDLLQELGAPPAETLISGPGLQRIHAAVCKLQGASECASLSDLLDPVRRSNPLVGETLEAFAAIFWHFAGNLVLAYGAWDGLIITGSIAAQSKAVLERASVRRHFVIPCPFSNRLCAVPTAIASFRHAELEGAAVALKVDEAHRSFVQPPHSALPADRQPIAAQVRPPSRGQAISRVPLGSPGLDRPLAGRRRPACV